MPVAFYVQVLSGRADVAWLRAAHRRGQHEDYPLDWLFDAIDEGAIPPDRRAWVSTGLPGRLLRSLSGGRYLAGDVKSLAAASRLSVLGAGRWLDVWLAIGAHPSVDQLCTLLPLGLSPYAVPSRAALDRLIDEVGDGGSERTALALLLLVAGSVPEAAAWTRAGVGDAVEVARAVAAGSGPARLADRVPAGREVP